MAHNIEIRNGIASFVENKRNEIAWHQLGTRVDGMLSVEDALKQSKADFMVEKQTIYYTTKSIEDILASGKSISSEELRELFMPIEGKKATIRTDYKECLGIVGFGYGVVQNKDAFAFIDMLCSGKMDGQTPIIETAGVLGHGERIFITAKFPEPIRIDNKEENNIDMYVVFTTSHDGMGAVQCMVTPIRVVCNNTLNWAMRNNNGKLSLRHTINVNNRLDITNKHNAEMAYKALSLTEVYRNSFEQSLIELAQIKVNDKQIEQVLVNSLLPNDAIKAYNAADYTLNIDEISTRSKNIVTNVTDAIHSGIGQSDLESGTGLWLVNGLTTYYQNEARFKDDESKMQSILDGLVNNKLQAVYENTMAMAI